MEVVALSKWAILRNLAGILPIALFAGFIYFVFGTAIAAMFLDGRLEDELVKPVAAGVTAALVAVSGLLYVRFMVNRLGQSRLALDDNTVLIRGLTSEGLVERRYALGDLDSITLGEQLNLAEQVLYELHQLGVPKGGVIKVVKDLKAGRLLVKERAGGQEVFDFIDKVFDRQSLLAFTAELSRRGVAICVPAEPGAAADRGLGSE